MNGIFDFCRVTIAAGMGPLGLAEFGHDFRNDERWLIINGETMSVGDKVLSGGGPQPTVVSDAGEKLLDRLLERHNSN
jgi:hypothetical protein